MAAVRGLDLISRQTSNPLMSGRFTSSSTSSAASTLLSPSRPVAASVTVCPARRSQVREDVALGLVVVHQQQGACQVGHRAPRLTRRMANASRSLVRSSLRSSAAARGGVATSRPVMTIAGSAGRQPVEQRVPVHAGHAQVGEHQVDVARVDGGERLRAVLGLDDLVGDAGQHRLEHLAEARVVVRDHDGADGRQPVRQA